MEEMILFKGYRVPKDAEKECIEEFIDMVQNTINDIYGDYVEIYCWEDYERWLDLENSLANSVIDEYYTEDNGFFD